MALHTIGVVACASKYNGLSSGAVSTMDNDKNCVD